tara:strand:- start:941 stop:1078 length:138 start_codon:yes stop_codon:yes gene_type:complete
MKYIIIFVITSIAGTAGFLNRGLEKNKTPVEYIDFEEPIHIIAKN